MRIVKLKTNLSEFVTIKFKKNMVLYHYIVIVFTAVTVFIKVKNKTTGSDMS